MRGTLPVMLKSLLICTALLVPCMAQSPRVPDIEAQRTAMKKLSFLVGQWSGEAHVLRPGGQELDLRQTEEAQYKLDGLLMTIEGTGRNPMANPGFRRSESSLMMTRPESIVCARTTMDAIWKPR